MRISKLSLSTVLVATLVAAFAILVHAQSPQTQQSAQQPQTPAPAAAPGPAFNLHQLGPNIYAAISNPGNGGNTGFVIGDDSVLVVDTFQTVNAAQQLLDAIRKITPLPIKFVVNTHYHLDHVAGNGIFAAAGATIFAEHNVREWIHTENPKFFGANITDDQKKMIAGLAGPQVVYDQGVDLYLGSRHIAVRVFPGHTGGDSIVFVPDANVVFTGDMFWCHTLPNTIDASTEPMMATLATLIAEHPDATFVPGHGQLGTVKDVTEFRGYIGALREAVKAAQAHGKTGQAILDAALPQLKEKYGDWGAFDRFGPRNINDTAAELTGQKKLPTPVAMH